MNKIEPSVVEPVITTENRITNNNILAKVPSPELDRIYNAGRVSTDSQRSFQISIDRSLNSTQGISIEQFIETNRKIKIEMKEYLDHYKVQRGLMEAVIYYLRHPKLASVRLVDRVGGALGRNLQLEAKKIASDPHAIKMLFEEMALSIEKSRNKTFELEKQAKVLYNAALTQRENIEKDITIILQKISANKDLTIKREDDYNKVKDNMNKLLTHMEDNLDMKVKGGKPIFELEGEISPVLTGEISPVSTGEISPVSTGDVKTLENTGDIKTVENIGDTETVENIGDETVINPITDTKEDLIVKDKKKIEAIKVYHSINDKLIKAENLLRDSRNEKVVLHQNYEKAKENLVLYERVLINQVNEARNYFALLFTIYDAEIKYTLPSARLIAYIASLQEVAIQLTQQIYDSRNIFNNLLDTVTQGALEIQEGIMMLAIDPSWDPVRMNQAETRTIELSRRTREFAIYMNRRLTEVETVYRYPDQTKLGTNKTTILDSGIDDGYLKKLTGRKE